MWYLTYCLLSDVLYMCIQITSIMSNSVEINQAENKQNVSFVNVVIYVLLLLFSRCIDFQSCTPVLSPTCFSQRQNWFWTHHKEAKWQDVWMSSRLTVQGDEFIKQLLQPQKGQFSCKATQSFVSPLLQNLSDDYFLTHLF